MVRVKAAAPKFSKCKRLAVTGVMRFMCNRIGAAPKAE